MRHLCQNYKYNNEYKKKKQKRSVYIGIAQPYCLQYLTLRLLVIIYNVIFYLLLFFIHDYKNAAKPKNIYTCTVNIMKHLLCVRRGDKTCQEESNIQVAVHRRKFGLLDGGRGG